MKPQLHMPEVRQAGKFSVDERQLLLSTPRIGPTVVARLESLGIHSLGSLRQVGVDAALCSVSKHVRQGAWANRRAALQQVIHRYEREFRGCTSA